MKLLDPTNLQYTISSSVTTPAKGVIETEITTQQLANVGLYFYQYVIVFSNGNTSTSAQAAFQAQAPLF